MEINNFQVSDIWQTCSRSMVPFRPCSTWSCWSSSQHPVHFIVLLVLPFTEIFVETAITWDEGKEKLNSKTKKQICLKKKAGNS